jgi:enolase
VNVLNGGRHADFALPFQEYLLVVSGTPEVAYEKTIGTFARLGDIIRRDFGDVPMGDEGGYAPHIKDVRRPFELLEEATEGDPSIGFAIDAAASEFFVDGKYIVSGTPYSGEDLMHLYESLVDRFHLRSIEDPFQEFDSLNFHLATTEFQDRSLVVGDDFTVTNPEIVRQAVAERCANAMIVTPNQIGTLTETFEAVREARSGGWKLIVSHRSGETTDHLIADLAVGLGAYGMKAGAPSQPERRAKYDRLLTITKEW